MFLFILLSGDKLQRDNLPYLLFTFLWICGKTVVIIVSVRYTQHVGESKTKIMILLVIEVGRSSACINNIYLYMIIVTAQLTYLKN